MGDRRADWGGGDDGGWLPGQGEGDGDPEPGQVQHQGRGGLPPGVQEDQRECDQGQEELCHHWRQSNSQT